MSSVARLEAIQATMNDLAKAVDRSSSLRWAVGGRVKQVAVANDSCVSGHLSPITCLEWSPDGAHLATGGYDGSVHIWDGELREPRLTIRHVRLVNGIRWSPDGTQLASASADKTVRISSADDGAMVDVLSRHTDDVNSLAWSPDGARIATVSEDGTGRIWDLETHSLIDAVLIHRDHCLAVDWHPRSGRLATCGEDATVRLWDEEGTLQAEWVRHCDMESCRWHPFADVLAVAGDSGEVHLLDGGGATVGVLGPHGGPVKSVSWSSDGRFIAAGSYDGKCTIWDVERVEVLEVLEAPRLWLRAIHVRPGSSEIAIGTFDSAPAIFSLKNGQCSSAPLQRTRELSTPSHGVNSLARGSGDEVLAGSDDGAVHRISRSGHEWTATVAATAPDNSLVNTVAYHSRPEVVAFGTFSGVVTILRPPDSSEGASSSVRLGAPINQVAFDPTGTSLAVATYTGECVVIDVDGSTIANRVALGKGAMKSVAWIDDRRAACAGSDGIVRILDKEDGVLAELRGHGNLVNSVDVTGGPGGPLIASASRDRTIRIWDVTTGKCMRVLLGHDESVKVVAWKPGSSHQLASGSYDFSVRVWDLSADDPESASVVLDGHTSGVGALVWAGRHLVSASWDGTSILWNAESAELVSRVVVGTVS